MRQMPWVKLCQKSWWIFEMVTGSPAIQLVVWQPGHRQFLDGHRLWPSLSS